MGRKIEEVRKIVIHQSETWIYYGGKPIPKTFKRDEWKLCVEDILRFKDDGHRKIAIIPRGGIGVGCQILDDKKIILCGERPEEMFID